MNLSPLATGPETRGYLHPDYAASLAEEGTPLMLPASKAWILTRPIPGTAYRDAIGSYPLFSCQKWSDLKTDLNEVDKKLVCLSVVPDPFGEHDPQLLVDCFEDVVRAFK